MKASERELAICRDLLERTAQVTRVTVPIMLSLSNVTAINHARNLAIYAIRQRTDLSYRELGLLFKRKKSTMYHSQRLVSEAIEIYPATQKLVKLILA